MVIKAYGSSKQTQLWSRSRCEVHKLKPEGYPKARGSGKQQGALMAKNECLDTTREQSNGQTVKRSNGQGLLESFSLCKYD
jgi:hypothetical protein